MRGRIASLNKTQPATPLLTGPEDSHWIMLLLELRLQSGCRGRYEGHEKLSMRSANLCDTKMILVSIKADMECEQPVQASREYNYSPSGYNVLDASEDFNRPSCGFCQNVISGLDLILVRKFGERSSSRIGQLAREIKERRLKPIRYLASSSETVTIAATNEDLAHQRKILMFPCSNKTKRYVFFLCRGRSFCI
jgi:hypothetical protein